MSSEELSEFERKLLAKEQARASQEPPPVNWDDVIPDVGYDISPEEQALDDAIKSMNIVDAYNRWCRKSRPDTRSGRQREGIKVSCPNVAHPDKHPSAWLNTEKNLYFCPGCSEGGDIWDIAAYHFGYPVPHYKRDAAQFRELREKIGTELGFATVKGLTGTFLLTPEQNAEPEKYVQPELEEPAPIGKLPSAIVAEEAQEAMEKATHGPEIDWRSIVPENTFLREWLNATTIDDCPEEYHFWTGLMAIGFAVGRNRMLADARPVAGNLFVCFVGPSGAGKSSAKSHLTKVIQDTMPYDYGNWSSQGVKFLSSPGSAEYIVKTFSAPIPDPVNPKTILGYAPVRAQIDFEELSSLTGISGRAGSVMKPVLLEVYDGAKYMGSGSLSHGDRVSRDPFGQVTSTTQDSSLKTLLAKGDDLSGFMNRWIFASGKLKPQRSLGGSVVDPVEAAAKLKEMHVWASTTQTVLMENDAFQRWDQFFHEVLIPIKKVSEERGSALLNRIDLLFKKLMLLFSCNMLEEKVSLVAVEQAIALYPYLLATYGVVQKEMAVTDESDLNDSIIKCIRSYHSANGKGPSLREIYPMVKKHGTQRFILDTVKNMATLGLIEEVPSPAGTRGRPTVRYIVNG